MTNEIAFKDFFNTISPLHQHHRRECDFKHARHLALILISGDHYRHFTAGQSE